jgi:hypothetical protein
MNIGIFAVAAAILVSASGATAPSAAPLPQSGNACLIEGTMMSEYIKDCTETDLPLPAAAYAEQCRANSAGEMKATPMKACPANAQASCVNPYGQRVKVLYYARSPQQLADTKTSCVAQKGKWVVKP